MTRQDIMNKTIEIVYECVVEINERINDFLLFIGAEAA